VFEKILSVSCPHTQEVLNDVFEAGLRVGWSVDTVGKEENQDKDKNDPYPERDRNGDFGKERHNF
jgi:hypothetical protein